MKKFDAYATMPKTVRIGGFEYRVRLMSAEEAEANSQFGNCFYFKQLISIAQDQPRQSLGNTLLHEVMHAIFFVFGPRKEEDGTNEQYTNQAANGMQSVIRDNPEFMTWLAQCFAVDEVCA